MVYTKKCVDKIKFSQLKEGDLFVYISSGEIYMKINNTFHDKQLGINAVNIQNGRAAYFTDENATDINLCKYTLTVEE